MVQEPQRVAHPRLARAVFDAREAGEERVADCRVRRERRSDKRETQLSVGVRDPRALLVEDRFGPRHIPQRELLRHVDVIGFGECQAGNLLLLAPHALEVVESVRRYDRSPKRVEVSGLQRRPGSRLHSVEKRLLQTARCAHTLGIGEKSPIDVMDIAEDSVDVLLLTFLRQCAQRQLEESGWRSAPFEHVIPERDPRRAARHGIADLRQVVQEVRLARSVELEQAVPGAFSIRQHITREEAARERSASSTLGAFIFNTLIRAPCSYPSATCSL